MFMGCGRDKSMSITFNADEILEMAEEIERNGAKFYRQAAKIAPDEKVQQRLASMADMEDGHLETFKQIREQLSEREKQPTTYDPENQAALYLRAMAEAHGCEGKISPTQELTGQETVDELIEIALNAEKESVVFYTGLKELVPVNAGRDLVDEIISEELSHITTLLWWKR
jgi:rubrerythrin